MEINDILSKLGLDFSNPEAKRGAIEAIDAILSSRNPMNGAGGGSIGGDPIEVELDPDLLQPSIKQSSGGSDDDDVEIEDEENILDQIKHNDSEEPNNQPSSDEDGEEAEDSSETDSDETHDGEQDSTETNFEHDTENSTKGEESRNNTTDELPDTDDEESDTDSASEVEPAEEDDEESTAASETDDFSETDESEDDADVEITGEDEEEDPEEDEDEFEFDEDDLLDGDLKSTTEDEALKAKHEARRIKRERTLAAAQKALADAKAKKVSPALIRELESAMAALEALTEAVSKNIAEISDEEFNQLINRVFDAIDAVGDSDLKYSSDEERASKIKEIKDDMASAQTQAELSAEDAAKIRAEHQAVKAREKETAKYTAKDRNSFKGFQEFLNSLYRAVALQVHAEETRDDSWSALSRRNSGAGVLRQGQKINELPNKKIPVIDFYFDQSSSWGPRDIEVGKKAVAALADMEEKGQIKLNIFYFADEVSSTPTSGSTSGWNEIVKNIITTQATNVVIMTDGDMQNWWTPKKKPPLRYTVPGYVWYLWRNGENAPRLPQDLKGRGGVQQFSFNINDV
jgi:hypothetical protein